MFQTSSGEWLVGAFYQGAEQSLEFCVPDEEGLGGVIPCIYCTAILKMYQMHCKLFHYLHACTVH